MKTPLLFLIFNRPELTQRVFNEIRKAQPEKLFIAADGPRAEKEDEAEKCAAARKVAEMVDWKCEVKTLFREENMGCRAAVSSAIIWFFEQVEEGIILEDDCLPSKSFFSFCENMLQQYRNNERVMHISGANFQDGKTHGNASYYFSIFPNIWGWASWKRAWRKYDIEMAGLETFHPKNATFRYAPILKYNMQKLKKTKSGEINTWDYQWYYSVWKNEGVAVVPNVNLVTNIGFGAHATHTTGHDDFLSAIPAGEIAIIKHPDKIKVTSAADNYYSWKLLELDGYSQYLTREARKKITSLIYPLYKKTKLLSEKFKSP